MAKRNRRSARRTGEPAEPSRAGFYNDQWGPLPYFIGPTPKEAVVAALFDPSAR